jgi:hypothetical protein
MRETIIRNLQARIESYAEFIATLDPADLTTRLAVPSDKSVAEHLWCIVGSRESYARALAEGEWQGFACSMTLYTHDDFARALAASGAQIVAAVRGVSEWSAAQDALLAAVAEHEVMHEGQLIRHMYALERSLPSSWRWA